MTMTTLYKALLFSFSIFLIHACGGAGGNTAAPSAVTVRFSEHAPAQSGLLFENILDEQRLVNPFSYINAYNGGGVGIGDINNDGLQDVYMTGNMVSSRLFLNKGNFKFEDITEKAGVGTGGWCTGVAMADVNNDGWTDIYICRSYYDIPQQKSNLLFLNNGNGTFTESASELGIDDSNYSIAASFFDFDRDGDLDLVVANHPRDRLVSLDVHYNHWINPPMQFSSRLFRNDGGKFSDVTKPAGILSYGFCLGVITSDLDCDGWPDIYLSVDHDEPDIVFYNNGDGTFTNATASALHQMSRSSMGIDAGDLNHDPYPDVLVVEMLSEDHFREKIIMSMQSVDRFQFIVDSLGYSYYQMRNFLHLNNGNRTFSDVAQLSAVHRTDWSWAALFFDADNDTWQDIFISNGYYRDIYNNDLFKPFDAQMMVLQDMEARNRLAAEYARNCEQTKIPNYLFRNFGDLRFANQTNTAGLGKPTISTGAAYGDLDNDGDLDLVINNIGEPSSIFENTTPKVHHYLRIQFAHHPGMASLGSKVIAEHSGMLQQRELLTTRGYQGSCEPYVHIGLGQSESVEHLTIVWPDGRTQVLHNVPANQTLVADYTQATGSYTPPAKRSFVEELAPSETGLDFFQRENAFNDYADQVLLPHKMSEQGPFTAMADVNADGLDDVFVGAPHGQAAVLFVQQSGGRFAKTAQPVFEADRNFEDTGSAFFDADGDGDPDLLVASGSYEWPANDPHYQPRLYLNDGKGRFTRAAASLPQWHSSASCVRPVDFDGDGDMDVFIGGRQTPKRYPEPGRSTLFLNDGAGRFINATTELCPGLEYAGMVKDAIWTDLNGDARPDLIAVGEWMPITFWVQHDGKLMDETGKYLPESPVGWWSTIAAEDLDDNGLQDFAVGNLGLNYKYKATPERPFSVFAGDFDQNGSFDIVLGAYYGDVMYPVRGRTCSSQQIPEIKVRFPTFTDYARADIQKVYGDDLSGALHYDATQFASVILYQDKPGVFSLREMPTQAQLAPVNGVVFHDVNGDQRPDIMLAGNLYQSEIETGRADAGTGCILLNRGDRQWQALTVPESGMYLAGDLKSLQLIRIGQEQRVVFLAANNKGPLQLVLLNGVPDI